LIPIKKFTNHKNTFLVLDPTLTSREIQQKAGDGLSSVYRQAAKVGKGIALWGLHDVVHATLLWAHAASYELETQHEVFTE
jgi:hypothetical protein